MCIDRITKQLLPPFDILFETVAAQRNFKAKDMFSFIIYVWTLHV